MHPHSIRNPEFTRGGGGGSGEGGIYQKAMCVCDARCGVSDQPGFESHNPKKKMMMIRSATDEWWGGLVYSTGEGLSSFTL